MKMSEYIDLIQMEKDEALRDYREDDFRMRLDRKIAGKKTATRSYVDWFRKPAIAGSSVLFLLSLAWLSRQFILPVPQVSEEMHLRSTLVQMFSQHENILNSNPLQTLSEPERSAIHEFEWSGYHPCFQCSKPELWDPDPKWRSTCRLD